MPIRASVIRKPAIRGTVSARSRRASPRFLLDVLRLASGAFASAQDSESTVDGERVEGGYYLLDAADRARQVPPALDDKVLTGWNGLAVSALARAGSRLGHPEWIDAAVTGRRPGLDRRAGAGADRGRDLHREADARGLRDARRRARGPRARDGRAAVRDSRAANSCCRRWSCRRLARQRTIGTNPAPSSSSPAAPTPCSPRTGSCSRATRARARIRAA